MKKIISVIVTLVLVLSMSITAFAAENSTHTVTGTYAAPGEAATVYNVEIAWGSMEFTYEVPADIWDGESHSYQSGGAAQWTYAEGANHVTVTNRSNAAVNVAVTTDTASSGITASVTNSSFQLGSAAEGATTEVSGKTTNGIASITLSGELTNKKADKSVIGSVTVTITAADTLPVLTDEDIAAAVEALKAGEDVTLINVSADNHATIVAVLDEFSDGALMSSSVHGISHTYTLKSTFSEAVAAWTDGMTLTMLGDATDLTEYIKTTAKGLVLDLNGHTLASSATLCTIWIDGDSSSELTIRDTKGGGYVQGNLYAVYSPSGMSKLCLESGTVERVDANGDFTMTGGTIRNEKGDALNTSSDLVKIVVSGGEIYSSKYAIYSYTSANIVVTGTAKLIGEKGIIDDRGVSDFTVTGGIFSHDPSAYVDTEQYTVTENNDGTWSVTAK